MHLLNLLSALGATEHEKAQVTRMLSEQTVTNASVKAALSYIRNG